MTCRAGRFTGMVRELDCGRWRPAALEGRFTGTNHMFQLVNKADIEFVTQ